MDLGGTPDLIHPDTKRQLAGFKNPAMPDGHAEKAGSKAYVDAYANVQRYAKISPRRPQDLHRVGMTMMNALERVTELEKGHEKELEQAAIDLVLGLPEFKAAKEAYEAGDLGIKVTLTQKVNLAGAAEDSEAEEEVDDNYLSSEAAKRRFINMMIQGNAASKLYAYHLAKDVLDKISPELIGLYGALSSAGHFFYWVVPDPRTGGGGGDGPEGDPAGGTRITVEDGVTTIHAEGKTFPMLVHELTKGLMEFLSYPEDEDNENRQKIFKQTDTLKNEPHDLRVGPEIWQQIVRHIGSANAGILPHVYDKLVRLPTTEFNTIMRGLLGNDPQAKAKLDKIIADEKRQQESITVRKLINDE